MIETATITVIEEVLDLAGLGNRVRGRVPDSLAGSLVVSVRRLTGWASETVAFRVMDGPLETELDTPVGIDAPTTPVEVGTAVIDDAVAGDVFVIGADAAEAGKVLVTVSAVVGRDAETQRRRDAGCGCGGVG